jgi:hypothetical protein
VQAVVRTYNVRELRVSLTKRLAALAEERQKLLRAYYANAIPLELLKRDQDRITESEEKAKSELVATEADLEKWQDVLTLAIGLAGSCHARGWRSRARLGSGSIGLLTECRPSRSTRIEDCTPNLDAGGTPRFQQMAEKYLHSSKTSSCRSI